MYRKWRQLRAILLVIAIVASFTACGGSTTKEQDAANNPGTSNQHPQSTDGTESPTEAEQEPEIIQETIEDKAKNAMETLEIWDGRIAESYGGGSGSAEDPYRITNGKQLAKLARDTNSGVNFNGVHFVLTDDILLNDITQWDFNSKDEQTSIDTWQSWMPIGNPDYNNTRFTGTFDGDGHTVWGLRNTEVYSTNGRSGGVGLFGSVYGSVSNVTIACVFLAPKAEYVGGIVAHLYEGNISNCHVKQAIIKPSISFGVGGICGDFGGNPKCQISNCSMDGNIICTKSESWNSSIFVGGIVGNSSGYQSKGLVTNCYSSCNISTFLNIEDIDSNNEQLSSAYVGGISGVSARIENCYSKISTYVECNAGGNENSDLNLDAIVGGIAGMCFNSIVNCGACGEINCSGTNMTNYAGGIVGWIDGDDDNAVNITFSYSNIKQDDDFLGGIAAKAVRNGGNISITNCYYSDNQYGSFGLRSLPSGVFMNLVDSLSETEMKKAESYVDWDFEMNWIQDDEMNDGMPIPRAVLELLN